MRRSDGFTLVELMIVVAIIGLLAVIAIPNYAKFAAKSRQVEARDGLSNIFTLETAYFSEKNTYGSLAQIGFVAEGRGRYTFCLSSTDCQAAAIDPVDIGAADGSGSTGSSGPIGPSPTPTPDVTGGGGMSCTGASGGGGCGGGGGGSDPTGLSGTSDDSSSGGVTAGGAPAMPGFPHYSASSFEADAYGHISRAPAPHDLDAWLIDSNRQLVNQRIGY